MQKYIEIGKIINTHGIKGELKILPLTDDMNRYKALSYVYIRRQQELHRYDIQGIKFLGGRFVVIKLNGIDNKASAEELRNLYLSVDREHAVELPEGTHFICDIIDCTVYDTDGNNLGILNDVLKTGSNDVYVVGKQDGTEILIPALKDVIKQVIIEEKKIIVSLPEGLMD